MGLLDSFTQLFKQPAGPTPTPPVPDVSAGLDSVPTAELETLNTLLSAQVLELKTRQRQIKYVLDKRAVEAEAQRKVALLSDPERAALAQAIQAAGTTSAEAVGIPK